MTVLGGPRRHRQGGVLTDVHLTCHVAPLVDYTVGIWYSADGEPPGNEIETVTIEAGRVYGFRALDGQTMEPFVSTVWPALPLTPDPPVGLTIVVGVDRAHQ